MSTSHKDLDLSFSQNLILLRIKYFKIPKAVVYANPKYKFLRKYYLVDYHPTDHTCLTLSDKGKMYLRFKRKDRFRFWIPVAISIVALLGGYNIYINPSLEKLLQSAVSQLKAIVESLGAFF